jgi:hypothetical protein
MQKQAYASRGRGHPCCKGGRLPAVCATRRAAPATVARRALARSLPFPGLAAWWRRGWRTSRSTALVGLGMAEAGVGAGEGACGHRRHRHRVQSRGGSVRPTPSSSLLTSASAAARSRALAWPTRGGAGSRRSRSAEEQGGRGW